ncbi:MAG: 30S ribosomal protein S20 [Parcubacteria group bacterium]|nr:30S ribosomal protein S20 [Parcubacteria group bacterium]
MPITKSAKKALRKSQRNRIKNLKKLNALKDAIKIFRSFVKGKKIAEAKKNLPAVFKILDKSAKINLIKKNRASRLKSRLSLSLNKSVK